MRSKCAANDLSGWVKGTAFTIYSVTYQGNENTGGSAPSTTLHASGANVTVASKPGSFAKTGYDFGGWNTANDGSGTNYTAGSGTISGIAANTTLYAKWTATITLNGNGATSAGSTSATVNYKSSTVSSITNPSKTDYTFAGWYSGSGGTGDLVINTSGELQSDVSGFTDEDGKWVATEVKTLYAKWVTAKVYTLLTDVANLYDGDEIVLVSYRSENSTYYALSTTQNTNNLSALLVLP